VQNARTAMHECMAAVSSANHAFVGENSAAASVPAPAA